MWIGTEMAPCSEFVKRSLDSSHAFGWFHPETLEYHVDWLDLPATPGATADLDDSNILALEREDLPADVNPTVYGVNVRDYRNWSVQADIAAGASAEFRERAGREWRNNVRQDRSLLSREPAAKLLTIDSGWQYFSSTPSVSFGGAMEADALLAMLSGGRKQYKVVATQAAAPYTQPQTITLQHARYGLSSLTGGHVIGFSFDSTRATVELIVVT
jgi:hypothetical protein